MKNRLSKLKWFVSVLFFFNVLSATAETCKVFIDGCDGLGWSLTYVNKYEQKLLGKNYEFLCDLDQAKYILYQTGIYEAQEGWNWYRASFSLEDAKTKEVIATGAGRSRSIWKMTLGWLENALDKNYFVNYKGRAINRAWERFDSKIQPCK